MIDAHYVPLLRELARFLECEESALQEKLNHPLIHERVNKYLQGKPMKTSYVDRNGQHKMLEFGRLSLKSNLEQHAYEGYLGVNLAQHFYCKFRIRLQYPRMRCAIEFSKSGHNRYYPLELLEIVHEGGIDNCIEPGCEQQQPPQQQKQQHSSFVGTCGCLTHDCLLSWCNSSGLKKSF